MSGEIPLRRAATLYFFRRANAVDLAQGHLTRTRTRSSSRGILTLRQHRMDRIVGPFWTRTATSGRVCSATSAGSGWEPRTQCWGQMSTTLMSVADGAEPLLTGLAFHESAANIAEFHWPAPQ